MKNLHELKGVKMLSKPEQKLINGGAQYCDEYEPCRKGFYCYYANGTSGYCLKGIS